LNQDALYYEKKEKEFAMSMFNDFSKKKWTWADKYLISSYEVDARGRATLPTLSKFMQETAYNHANHLEFGYVHLKQKNRFWVLSRLLIKIDRYPLWGETVHVHTWPTGVEGLFAYRDFQLLDEQEVPIGAASSGWLVLDAEKRRPQRPLELKEKSRLFPEERALDRRPLKIKTLSEPEKGPFFPVRYSDLDLYNHVNNAKYIQWILDSYPEEMNREYEVTLFEINFVSESKMGDEVAIYTERLESSTSEPAFRHGIKRKVDNRDICLAETTWRTSGV
jgi:medium-chain acyl-[acyl-carrier-protein] hydrolase